MRLTAKAWSDYADRLSRLNTKAGQLMRAYLERYGAEDTSALISYASALVDKYGEGSAELACQMYDAMAEAAGLTLPAAEPAAPAAYGELAKAVNGTKHSPALLQSAVSRLVKQAGADTTLKNAIRDGAEFAWIPHGDTCAFCLMLASRGWQKAGKRTLKNGHAEHIHANCDCEYAVRFNASTTVAGYDPEQYLAAYRGAEGRTYQEKLNALRRAHYAENRKKITAQKRAAYLAKKQSEMAQKTAESRLQNAAGKTIIEVQKTALYGAPASITQVVTQTGGITRNYYDSTGKWIKQISNNDHGNAKHHPYGKHGEHAHDIVWKDGAVVDRPVRELTEEERKENGDIL